MALTRMKHINIQEIERLWKIAKDDPNHDTNWHDPAVVKFANLIAQHTLEEVAKEFDKMPFGDTSASFAIFVRNMKT